MSEKSSFAKFLVGVFAPILLIAGGAGLAGLGFSAGWTVLVWAGLIIAAAGLLWGGLLLLIHGPLDW